MLAVKAVRKETLRSTRVMGPTHGIRPKFLLAERLIERGLIHIPASGLSL